MSEFRTAATRLFGTQVSARLARAVQVGQRAAQRWLSEATEPPADVREFVTDQEARLARSAFRVRLEAALADASREGVHREVIAAQLADLHEITTNRPTA